MEGAQEDHGAVKIAVKVVGRKAKAFGEYLKEPAQRCLSVTVLRVTY
jgi:hypothetical protein